MIKVLFVCPGNACMSQFAEAYARTKNNRNVTVLSGGVDVCDIDPLVLTVMKETGLPTSDATPKLIDDIMPAEFDLVITMCDQSYKECPVLMGQPPVVNWNLPVPDLSPENPLKHMVLKELATIICKMVDDLFDHGYLDALAKTKRQSNLLLDSMKEAIIAHDNERRIYYFNRAAERLTGFTRSDVLYRDCHDVFENSFCGGQCAFHDDDEPPDTCGQQTVYLTCKDGTKKYVEMSVQPMLEDGVVRGRMAFIQDLTPRYTLNPSGTHLEAFPEIIGVSPPMIELLSMVRDVSVTNVPVFVNGETGTGKEVIARAVHEHSPRKNNLFVPINCGALPENLLESELFGYVKGAFTGATRDKKGRFEIADGGTIFLDEIGDISLAMQVKLLRVLQEGTFERVGSEKTTKVDVRIVSATNKNLKDEIKAGRFRQDLYYRIGVVPVKTPALRERKSDIPLLADSFLTSALAQSNREGVQLSADTIDLMLAYNWPGNIRELQNWIQFAIVKCKGSLIKPEHLPQFDQKELNYTGPKVRRTRKRKLDIDEVKKVLKKVKGNKMKAAKELGVGRATLYRFIDDYSHALK